MVETAPETPDVDATADDDDAPPPRLLRVSDLVKAAAEGNFTDEVKFIAAMGACLDGSTVDMVLNKNDRAFVQIASKVYGQMDEQGTWNGEWDQEKRTFTPTDPAADPTYTLVKPLRDINIETLVFRRLKVRDLVGVYNGQRTGNVEISRALLAKATGVRERALDQLHIGDWMAAQDGLRPFLPVLTTGLLSLAS